MSVTVDDFIKNTKQIELPTSEGVKSCENIDFEESIIHVMQDNMYSTISNDKACRKMNKLFSESKFSGIKTPSKNIYIPIKKSKFYDILPHVRSAVIVNTEISTLPVKGYNDGPNYAQCKLYLSEFKNRNTDIIQELDEKIFYENSLSGVRVSILSLLEQVDDCKDIDLQEVSNYA